MYNDNLSKRSGQMFCHFPFLWSHSFNYSHFLYCYYKTPHQFTSKCKFTVQFFFFAIYFTSYLMCDNSAVAFWPEEQSMLEKNTFLSLAVYNYNTITVIILWQRLGFRLRFPHKSRLCTASWRKLTLLTLYMHCTKILN